MLNGFDWELIICIRGKFRGILLHVGRTSSGKSAMNAILGGRDKVTKRYSDTDRLIERKREKERERGNKRERERETAKEKERESESASSVLNQNLSSRREREREFILKLNCVITSWNLSSKSRNNVCLWHANRVYGTERKQTTSEVP